MSYPYGQPNPYAYGQAGQYGQGPCSPSSYTGSGRVETVSSSSGYGGSSTHGGNVVPYGYGQGGQGGQYSNNVQVARYGPPQVAQYGNMQGYGTAGSTTSHTGSGRVETVTGSSAYGGSSISEGGSTNGWGSTYGGGSTHGGSSAYGGHHNALVPYGRGSSDSTSAHIGHRGGTSQHTIYGRQQPQGDLHILLDHAYGDRNKYESKVVNWRRW